MGKGREIVAYRSSDMLIPEKKNLLFIHLTSFCISYVFIFPPSNFFLFFSFFFREKLSFKEKTFLHNYFPDNCFPSKPWGFFSFLPHSFDVSSLLTWISLKAVKSFSSHTFPSLAPFHSLSLSLSLYLSLSLALYSSCFLAVYSGSYWSIKWLLNN